MKEDIYNEKELKAVEEEIRSMGIPYSENEPDERYFANFRVRLMERIEEKEEKQSVFAGAWEWLVSSPLRYLSLGATLAGIIVGVFLMRPVSEPQVATIQTIQPKVEIPSVIPPKEVKQEIALAVKPQTIKPKVVMNPNITKNENRKGTLNSADKTGDLSFLDATLSDGESDDPINMEKLSESELESVIAIAQGME